MIMLWLLLTLLAAVLVTVAVRAIVADRHRPRFEIGAPIIERECEVYVLWPWPHIADRPVYIGEGYEALDRIEAHERDAEWWPLVDPSRTQIESHPSKYAAKRREEYLIDTMDPLKNKRRRNKGIHVAA